MLLSFCEATQCSQRTGAREQAATATLLLKELYNSLEFTYLQSDSNSLTSSLAVKGTNLQSKGVQLIEYKYQML